MQLYSYWRSSCSYRVRILLELKELEYEYVSVNLIKDGGEQHSKTYQELNPSREVPLLIDGGLQISQSMVILDYLEIKYPTKPLIPQNQPRRFECLEICELVNSSIQPLQNLKVLQYLSRELNLQEEGKNQWIKNWIFRGLESIEKRLARGKNRFCCGELPMAADAFLVPQIYNALRFNVSLDAFPEIHRIFNNCQKLEAFMRASPERQPDAVLDSTTQQ